MAKLKFQDIMNILQFSGEDERIEAKTISKQLGKSILETISAFSNEHAMGGGYLVLGVSRNTNECPPFYDMKGIADPDKIQCELATLCRQVFNIAIFPEMKVVQHEGKNILIVYISEAQSHEKPVYMQNRGIKQGAFRRIGPTDQRCTQEDLNYLYRKQSDEPFDDKILETTSFDDVDPAAI